MQNLYINFLTWLPVPSPMRPCRYGYYKILLPREGWRQITNANAVEPVFLQIIFPKPDLNRIPHTLVANPPSAGAKGMMSTG